MAKIYPAVEALKAGDNFEWICLCCLCCLTGSDARDGG
jgi:hypothetical protein